MKKNTLLLVVLLVSGVTFSQTEMYVSETGGVNDPIVYVDVNYPDDPCGVNNESNAFENGKSCTRNINRIVANDFIVPGGEELTLKSMLVNVFIGATGSGVNALEMDIIYYNDNGGEPGAIIGGEFGFWPTSQAVVGTNFGFDIWQIELDVTDRVFHDQAGNPATYWIGLTIEATDGSNLFWENSTLGISGSGEAYDDGTGNYNIDSALEGVYEITADCVPRLGVEDNFADRVQIFPNPASGEVITIQTPFSEEKQIVVFDILGKKVIDTGLQNDQLNVSTLTSGVYLIRINQNNATATKKLVIR